MRALVHQQQEYNDGQLKLLEEKEKLLKEIRRSCVKERRQMQASQDKLKLRVADLMLQLRNAKGTSQGGVEESKDGPCGQVYWGRELR